MKHVDMLQNNKGGKQPEEASNKLEAAKRKIRRMEMCLKSSPNRSAQAWCSRPKQMTNSRQNGTVPRQRQPNERPSDQDSRHTDNSKVQPDQPITLIRNNIIAELLNLTSKISRRHHERNSTDRAQR